MSSLKNTQRILKNGLVNKHIDAGIADKIILLKAMPTFFASFTLFLYKS